MSLEGGLCFNAINSTLVNPNPVIDCTRAHSTACKIWIPKFVARDTSSYYRRNVRNFTRRGFAQRSLVKPAARWRAIHLPTVLVATALWASPSLAEDDPPEASKSLRAQGKSPAPHCDDPHAEHPHNYQDVCNTESVGDLRAPQKRTGSGSSELASKLANPSAPVLQLTTFMDVTQNGGSLPGAHRGSFTLNIQPVLPVETYRGNLLFRPLISVDFGQPFVTASGNVDGAVQFGNVALDSVFGKTFKNGLLLMGGVNTVFPTGSKSELRADWTFGPEIVIGYASKKTGNVWGAIVGYFWSFPSDVQSVGGQYFYAINLGGGWQVAASPTWSYVRDINLLRFPLGVGVSKVGALGKKDFPLKLAAQLWGYTPPPDGSGPEWQIRITVSPIFNRPWQQQGAGTLRNRRKSGG